MLYLSPQRAQLNRRLSTSDVQTSASDANASDNLTDHVTSHQPRDNDTEVALGTSITVTFDRDVRTVNISKLFEVSARGVVLWVWHTTC